MSRQPERFVHFFKQGVYVVCLFVTTSVALIACSDKTTESQFSYQLAQRALQPELVSPLRLQIQENKIGFAISFEAGSGAYDAARLERAKDTVQVILFDTDAKVQKIFVIYQLSGSISDIEPGEYTFQIVGTDERLVGEESFTVQ